MKEAVALWAILRSRKRPGVLSCAVREAGIPPAVRARILTETSRGPKRPREVLCDD